VRLADITVTDTEVDYVGTETIEDYSTQSKEMQKKAAHRKENGQPPSFDSTGKDHE